MSARLFVVGLMLMALAAAPALAQSGSALVVIVPGDKQFHQPTCAVVARAGSKVKVSKQADAVRRGLEQHDCEAEGDASSSADPNAVKVFTQKNDNKYHRETCKKLGEKRTAIILDEAGRKFWPCPVCEPPIRKRVQKSD
jgi:5-enolpyruvylshikimate-3-phosphate synthase